MDFNYLFFKIKYIEEAKIKNAPYLEKIRKSNFFAKKEEKNTINKNVQNKIYQFPNKITILTPPNKEQTKNFNKPNQQLQQHQQHQQHQQVQANIRILNQENFSKNKFNRTNDNFSPSSSFLMKSENKINTINPNVPELALSINRTNGNLRGYQQISPISQISQLSNPIPNFSSPQMNNFQSYQNFQGLEQKVESISEKLTRLENRVEKNEKITFSARDDIKELRTNLDKNFSKLDLVLEKLAIKLK